MPLRQFFQTLSLKSVMQYDLQLKPSWNSHLMQAPQGSGTELLHDAFALPTVFVVVSGSVRIPLALFTAQQT